MNTFSFGFADDDIGYKEDALQLHSNQQSDLPNTLIFKDEERIDDEPARLWNIQEYLEDFAPCQIDVSYTTLRPQSEEPIHIPRRATFNWQMDLMASENAPPSPILRGTGLVPGFYEGGWQIWEGAKDLAEYLLKNIDSIVSAEEGDKLHVVELGAGLAVPSLTVFYHFLMNRKDSSSLTSLKPHFTLSDYNASVLRHGTAPALFTTWFLTRKHLSRSKAYVSSSPPSDLELQPDDLEAFYKDMVYLDFNVDFVSGPWGKEFIGLMTERKVKRIVLASETIYSLETLPTFTSTLLGILRQRNVTEGSRAYVAAKRLYFGVGGGVDVFVRLVEESGGAVKVVWEADQGVSRVILEVRGYS